MGTLQWLHGSGVCNQRPFLGKVWCVQFWHALTRDRKWETEHELFPRRPVLWPSRICKYAMFSPDFSTLPLLKDPHQGYRWHGWMKMLMFPLCQIFSDMEALERRHRHGISRPCNIRQFWSSDWGSQIYSCGPPVHARAPERSPDYSNHSFDAPQQWNCGSPKPKEACIYCATNGSWYRILRPRWWRATFDQPRHDYHGRRPVTMTKPPRWWCDWQLCFLVNTSVEFKVENHLILQGYFKIQQSLEGQGDNDESAGLVDEMG